MVAKSVMREDLAQYLCCPTCRGSLERSGSEPPGLRCASCARTYEIVGGIPRFVDSRNYASSFGFQWKTFSKVQLDSYNHSDFSEARFRTITEWRSEDLQGKLVLDAGCGAGRFAEVVLDKYRANVVACDLSNAVEASRDNLQQYGPLICQASIYELPFRSGQFDFVYCIGVIQHTPDPHETIRALCRLVKPGGQIGLWIYEMTWKSLVGTSGFKYALRPITRRLSRGAQLRFSKFLVDVFHPVASVARRMGVPGKIIMRLLPIAAAHLHSVELSRDDFKTWLFLDTFDMYSPAFDQPQRFPVIARLLESEGFENIRRHPHGAISITATRAVPR